MIYIMDVKHLISDLNQSIAKYSAYLDKDTLDHVKVNAAKDAECYKVRYGLEAQDTLVMELLRQASNIRMMLIKSGISNGYNLLDTEVCITVNQKPMVIDISELYRVTREASSYIYDRIDQLTNRRSQAHTL